MKKLTDADIREDFLDGLVEQFSETVRKDKTMVKAINKRLLGGEKFKLQFTSEIAIEDQNIKSSKAGISFSEAIRIDADDLEIDVSGQPPIETDGKKI